MTGTEQATVDTKAPEAKAKIAGLLKTLGALESGSDPKQSVTEASKDAQAAQDAQPKRGEDGKFAPKNSAAEPAAEPAAKAEPAVDSAAYESARATLRRAKTPQSVIDSMKPQEVLAWAKDVEPLHKQNDEHARQLGELRKQMETKAVKPESPTAPQQGSQGEQPVDFKALVQPIAKQLALTDPGEVEALARFAQQISEAANASAKKSIDAALGGLGLDRLRGSVAEMEMRNARAELSSRYSQLADDTEFNDVVGVMGAKLETLKQQGVDPRSLYSSMSDLLNEVCAVRYVTRLQAEAASDKHRKVQSDRDGGRAERPTQPAQKAALTHEQRVKATIGDTLRSAGVFA